MTIPLIRRFCLALAIVPFALLSTVHAEDWETLFDGKTLKGWDGNPEFWRVEDGAITGQTTEENPTKGNTFLIWQGGELENFVLELEYKLIGGNSGIQYRAYEHPSGKWVIAGYQADFESGDRFSGILYSEKERGILALRGQKTVIGENGKPKVVGSVGDAKELQAGIKKEEWNTYRITGDGFQFTHEINGVKMVEVTDEDTDKRRAKGLLALQLHAGPPMTVQFRNIRLKRLPTEEKNAGKADTKTDTKNAAANAPKRVLFIAGRRSHGFGAHEHRAGCILLAEALEQAMPNFNCAVIADGWPKTPRALEGFDAIVMYSDGGGGHMVNDHLEEVQELVDEGVGIVAIHYAVEVPKGEPGDRFLDWIGGYFETWWSVNPHWTAEFKEFPAHPVANGVKPFTVNDEWYYNMRFQPEMKGVTPILSAIPPESTLKRQDGPHSNNPHVRKMAGQPQHVGWAYERPDGGRGFGFTGGHNHWNWGNESFRKVVLNAIVWTAETEVPKNGVPLKPITPEDLLKNQDFNPPANFSTENIQQKLDDWNGAE